MGEEEGGGGKKKKKKRTDIRRHSLHQNIHSQLHSFSLVPQNRRNYCEFVVTFLFRGHH